MVRLHWTCFLGCAILLNGQKNWLLKQTKTLSISVCRAQAATLDERGPESGQMSLMILGYSTQSCIEYVMKSFRLQNAKNNVANNFGLLWRMDFLLSNHSYILHEKGCGNRTMRPMFWVHKRILKFIYGMNFLLAVKHEYNDKMRTNTSAL